MFGGKCACFRPIKIVVAISIASANAQIIKCIGVGITADINHILVEIEKPCAYLFASRLADGILHPARMYSITRKARIAAYDIAKLPDVSPKAPWILIVRVLLPSSAKAPVDDGPNHQSQILLHKM